MHCNVAVWNLPWKELNAVIKNGAMPFFKQDIQKQQEQHTICVRLTIGKTNTIYERYNFNNIYAMNNQILEILLLCHAI